MGFAIAVVVIAIIFLSQTVKVLNEYERAVVFRLGRRIGPKGPGLILLIPVVDRMVKISLRTVTMDVPTQDVITKDNVSVRVNAVVFFRVVDPMRAVIMIENFLFATSQAAQTTLRSIVGESELDDLLSRREEINLKLQTVIDHRTDPWGVKVVSVELKDVDLPQEMKRAMAKQAEAERERRAKVIAADGELQAAQKLSEAAQTMQQNPMSLQLRYMQTLAEIATENNSTTVFPLPIDLISAFLKK